MIKLEFRKEELIEFAKLYHNLMEGNAQTDLVLYLDTNPYSFQVIAIEIKNRTKLGRRLLDKIIDMRLI